MSKIAEILKSHKKMFVPFITAGDPDLETTKKLILAMEEAGATIIELGIPFSDPMAEGPVIQEADIRALNAGTTTDKVFDMIKEVRKETDIPLVFLTYANPIFHYGTDKFYARCAEAGVDGTIVPDVPYEERGELETACEKYGVDRITNIGRPDPADCQRCERVCVHCFQFGRDRCSQRDYNGYRDDLQKNPGSDGYAGCRGLWYFHPGPGGRDGPAQRRGHRGQRYCEDDRGVRQGLRGTGQRICKEDGGRSETAVIIINI